MTAHWIDRSPQEPSQQAWRRTRIGQGAQPDSAVWTGRLTRAATGAPVGDQQGAVLIASESVFRAGFHTFGAGAALTANVEHIELFRLAIVGALKRHPVEVQTRLTMTLLACLFAESAARRTAGRGAHEKVRSAEDALAHDKLQLAGARRIVV